MHNISQIDHYTIKRWTDRCFHVFVLIFLDMFFSGVSKLSHTFLQARIPSVLLSRKHPYCSSKNHGTSSQYASLLQSCLQRYLIQWEKSPKLSECAKVALNFVHPLTFNIYRLWHPAQGGGTVASIHSRTAVVMRHQRLQQMPRAWRCCTNKQILLGWHGREIQFSIYLRKLFTPKPFRVWFSDKRC